jgi:hypothetical protein
MATTASLDDEEEELIAQGRSIFDVFATEGEARRTRARPLKQMRTIDRLRLKRDIKTGRLVGEGQALIRAPPEHILAYLSDTTGKHFQSRLNRNIYVRYETREVKNDHHAVLLIEMKTEPFRNRLLLVSVIWKKLSDDSRSYVWVVMSIDSHPSVSAHEEHHCVRAHVARCVIITDIGDGSSRLQYAMTSDLRGHFPECTPRPHAGCARAAISSTRRRLPLLLATPSAPEHAIRFDCVRSTEVVLQGSYRTMSSRKTCGTNEPALIADIVGQRTTHGMQDGTCDAASKVIGRSADGLQVARRPADLLRADARPR